MAVDPFDDDPIADAERQASWLRRRRDEANAADAAELAATGSVARVVRRQERNALPFVIEGEERPGGSSEAEPRNRPAESNVGGGDTAEALRELNEHARAIKQLLEEIKAALPFVGAYGP